VLGLLHILLRMSLTCIGGHHSLRIWIASRDWSTILVLHLHRLPRHSLALHRLPLHRLPLHRLAHVGISWLHSWLHYGLHSGLHHHLGLSRLSSVHDSDRPIWTVAMLLGHQVLMTIVLVLQLSHSSPVGSADEANNQTNDGDTAHDWKQDVQKDNGGHCLSIVAVIIIVVKCLRVNFLCIDGGGKLA